LTKMRKNHCCLDCGKMFKPNSNAQLRCRTCIPNQAKRYYLKYRAKQGHIALTGRTCKNCGNSFDASGARQKICVNCKLLAEKLIPPKGSPRTVHNVCIDCNTTFTTTSRHGSARTSRCRACLKIHTRQLDRERNPAKTLALGPMEGRTCDVCGTKFNATNGQQKACSIKCGKSRRRVNGLRWAHRQIAIKIAVEQLHRAWLAGELD
jgi:hypothetical protein